MLDKAKLLNWIQREIILNFHEADNACESIIDSKLKEIKQLIESGEFDVGEKS